MKEAKWKSDKFANPALWPDNRLVRHYLTSTRMIHKAAFSEATGGFVMVCIIMAGVLVGLQTYTNLEVGSRIWSELGQG